MYGYKASVWVQIYNLYVIYVKVFLSREELRRNYVFYSRLLSFTFHKKVWSKPRLEFLINNFYEKIDITILF